ncbi:MAG: tetratricopeptide repeat protein [Planctomycetes bacterium]|nr:tetratricopeptide repeat protein [Planctomycetota bacterium]
MSESSPTEQDGSRALRALVERTAPSVVSVIPYDADYNTLTEGSGFFTAEGRIVTCRHLFQGAKSARVMRSDGSVHDVLGILAEDSEADLVLAAVDIPDRVAVPLSFSHAAPRTGESLAVVGGRLSPSKDGLTGEFVGARELPVLGQVLRITARLEPTSSGAPVLAMDGEVVGMVVSRSLPQGSFAYVVPAPRLDDLSSTEFVKVGDHGGAQAGRDPDRFLPACALLLKDDLEGALRELEALAGAGKKDAAAWSAVADAQLALNRPREAMLAARAAVGMDPEDADAWSRLGAACTAAGLAPEAVDACKRVVKLRPKSARAWNRLGVACYNAGRPAEAADSCREAIRIEPDDAQEHKNLGVAYFALKRYPEAAEAFREAVRLRPGFDHAWKNLGMTYYLMGSYEKAVDATREAVKIRPDYARAYNNLGVSLQALGRTDEAVDCYQAALRIKPRFSQARANLAYAYAKKGMHEESVKTFEEALARDDGDADARANFGALLWKLKRVDEAKNAFLDAIRVEPKHAPAHYQLGLLLLEKGDRGGALEEYKVLKTLDGEKAEALFSKIYR